MGFLWFGIGIVPLGTDDSVEASVSTYYAVATYIRQVCRLLVIFSVKLDLSLVSGPKIGPCCRYKRL